MQRQKTGKVEEKANRRQKKAAEPIGGLLQRTCACGRHTVGGAECQECQQKSQKRQAESGVPVSGGLYHGSGFIHNFSQVPVQAKRARPAGGLPVSEDETRPIGGMRRRVQRTIGDGHDLIAPQFQVPTKSNALEAAFDGEQVVTMSATGEAVEKIQKALLTLGYLLPGFGVDGIFGSETRQALTKFQHDQSIAEDGIVGPDTMTAFDTQLSSGTSPVQAAPAPATPSITLSTASGPTFNPCGDFNLQISWDTNAFSGYIVQEIINVYNATNCDGTPDTTVTPGIVPHYWEAWQIGSDDVATPTVTGIITPDLGGVHDFWIRPPNPNTQGNWSMTGNAFYVSSLDPAANFVPGSVSNAGVLLATTSAPTNLGSALLTRTHGGTWDCCNGNNTHDPA